MRFTIDGLTLPAMPLTSMLLFWPVARRAAVAVSRWATCCCDGKMLDAFGRARPVVGADRVAEHPGEGEEARDRERSEAAPTRRACVTLDARGGTGGGVAAVAGGAVAGRAVAGRSPGRWGPSAAGAAVAGEGVSPRPGGTSAGTAGKAETVAPCGRRRRGATSWGAPGSGGRGGTRTEDSARPILRGTCSGPAVVLWSLMVSLVTTARASMCPTT